MSTTKTNEILERIKSQYTKNQPKPKKQKFTAEQREEFLKKYFNTANPGEYIFRILPTNDDSSPFKEGYFHHIKVNGKWNKLSCPQKNDKEKCPLCEAEAALKSTGKEGDFELSRTYQSSLFYIVKGIDREKVEDGVKFWRFKHNWKQNGIFDKILPVFTKKGDITDPINGRDIIITATETTGTNNIVYTTVSSIMPEDVSRLSDDDEQLKELVNDKLTWKDVYKSKEVEYLQAVVEGKAPYWDESQKKMITPGGASKKTLKVVDSVIKNDITIETKTETTSPRTNGKEVDNTKSSKKLKKQTEDVFETSDVSDGSDDGEEESNDLPF